MPVKKRCQSRSECQATLDAAHFIFATLMIAVASHAEAPDHPSVVVQGRTCTPRSILERNMGTPEDQVTAFPPHKILGNMFNAILLEQEKSGH